ncbi:hypothetical protein [Brevibacterium litoralis]|uniref:hypothetical protein n=1 Tax=Brevibacterium litoralis TaxID=3138935 RepID=UPI0032F05DEE
MNTAQVDTLLDTFRREGFVAVEYSRRKAWAWAGGALALVLVLAVAAPFLWHVHMMLAALAVIVALGVLVSGVIPVAARLFVKRWLIVDGSGFGRSDSATEILHHGDEPHLWFGWDDPEVSLLLGKDRNAGHFPYSATYRRVPGPLVIHTDDTMELLRRAHALVGRNWT